MRDRSASSASSPGRRSPPVFLCRLQPSEMVQPSVVKPKIFEGLAEGGSDAPAHPCRSVTYPDRAIAEHSLDRFGHQARRIGEIQEPHVGGPVGNGLRDLQHHGHGSERGRDPARSDGLLAQHSFSQRHRFVDDPARQAPDPDREDTIPAPSSAASRSVVVRTGGPSPCSLRWPSITATMRCRRDSLTS